MFKREPRTVAVDEFIRGRPRGGDLWEEERRQFIEEARRLRTPSAPDRRILGEEPVKLMRTRQPKKRRR